MSLTLIKRPLGHRLNTTDISAQIIDDGQGDALVYTGSAHGLSDGDYVYIESNLDSYNGFKYVDSIAYDSFKIKNSEDGDFVLFVQDADISYRTSVLNHGWQAVHNLIVYELQSDLWPNNVAEEAYIPNTIDSFSNNNGYVQLNLDQALSGATVRNWIELVGDNTLAGPYQIIAAPFEWAIVINLAYDAALSFTGLQVVNYYNNYAINVEVWAGLDAAHRWASKKPYELAATLKFIPDTDGKIKFSIAEILKGYVTTRNNLTLDTLPNNLDFHVSFYIKYFESYDSSGGTEVTTFEDDPITDSFEGHAVNAMMPFKSLNSGYMSDYVNEDTFLARWLTLFDVPLMIVDRFFDLSFINQYDGATITVTKNGVLFLTLDNPGSGILRIPITPSPGDTELCFIAYATIFQPPLNQFVNRAGANPLWTLGDMPGISLISTQTSTELEFDYPFVNGTPYTITVELTGTSGVFSTKVTNGAYVTQFSNTTGAAGDITIVLAFTATVNTTKIVFTLLANTGDAAVVITSLVVNPPTQIGSPIQITEQICCNVITECDSTLVDDVLRITEGTEPRIIE